MSSFVVEWNEMKWAPPFIFNLLLFELPFDVGGDYLGSDAAKPISFWSAKVDEVSCDVAMQVKTLGRVLIIKGITDSIPTASQKKHNCMQRDQKKIAKCL